MVPDTVYRVLDHALTLFVVTPIVVTFWRGVWYWLDLVLVPWNDLMSSWCSLLLGHSVLFLLTLGQGALVSLGSRPTLFRLLGPAYNAIYALATVSQWRSVWLGSVVLTGQTLGTGLRGWVVSILLLCTLRALPSCAIVPPFFLQATPTDPNKHFEAPMWFRSKVPSSLLKYTLDAAFSVFFIQSCVVIFWRSSWLLADCLFYPDEPPHVSVCISLVLGISMSSTAYLCQNMISIISKHLHGLPRILVQDTWVLFLGVSAVNVWRGVWGALDLILPSYDPSGVAVTFLVAAWLAQAFFGVTVFFLRGLVLDGDFPRDKMAVLSISFFMDCVIKKKKKPLKKKVELITSTEKPSSNHKCPPGPTQV